MSSSRRPSFHFASFVPPNERPFLQGLWMLCRGQRRFLRVGLFFKTSPWPPEPSERDLNPARSPATTWMRENIPPKWLYRGAHMCPPLRLTDYKHHITIIVHSHHAPSQDEFRTPWGKNDDTDYVKHEWGARSIPMPPNL
ncbi:hypothetical protein PGQ11_011490 [Apiospora arundinis]|uniref:Uncharacterized protein n=1 Tax=Apiospora arundinis TaxID=335852 RepID=A0ABR2HZS9_9PEZI